MLSQKDVNRLMAEAEKAGAKVVFTGDSRQLSAVNAGKPFEMMQAKGMKTAEMTEIHRQKTDALKDAVASIIERREQDAFKKLEGGLVEQKDSAKLIQRIVSDAKDSAAAEIKAGLAGGKQAGQKDTLIITALNEDHHGRGRAVWPEPSCRVAGRHQHRRSHAGLDLLLHDGCR